MAKKTREPEERVEPQDADESELEDEDGELLPNREAPSVLPTPDEMLRGPFPNP